MAMDKKFDPKAAEPAIYQAWEASGAFAAGANAKPGAESFCIVIPPPNVTGSLHIGHALNNTLQDILIRWKRMQGYDTLWQPGQDHAGIATQMVVERQLAAEGNEGRAEMGREKFLERVWNWKAESGGTIIEQLKRLGATCDWSRNAFTMSGAPGAPAGEEGNLHDAVLKVFVELYEKGLIYRGKRLVNWDPKFETAISDLEVENIEVDGHMWHFKYPLAGGASYEYVEKDENGEVTLRETRDYISIATTRPETMLGDGAVAVHPSDERYAPIVGKLCEIPVGPKEHRRLIPIITDDYPDPEFGSGAVKITGAHDFNDYGVARRSGIPCYRLMDVRAAMRADGAPYAEEAAKAQAIIEGAEMSEAEIDAINLVPDEYRGMDRYEARERIVRQITADGLAVKTHRDDPNTQAPLIDGADRKRRRFHGVWEGPEGEVYLHDSLDEVINEASARYPEHLVQEDIVANHGVDVPDDIAEVTDGFYDPSSGRQIKYIKQIYPLVESKKIMQPFGDRSKVVIEPMLTDQWFVDAGTLAKPALAAVKEGRTNFHPDNWKSTYFHWLENIEPWCISRQLWWGHQIPVWYGPAVDAETGKLDYDQMSVEICALSAEGAKDKAKEIYGVEYVFETPPENASFLWDDEIETASLLGQDGKKVSKENGRPNFALLLRDPDVLDTWFSSALWPYSTLGWPEKTPELEKYYQTDVLITGNDIIFFWVARMMMTGIEFMGEEPFHSVYINSIVTDAKGKKMSKSVGNVIDPLDLIDQYGADAVRFTLASQESQARRQLRLAVESVEGGRNFGTKIWNAARFAEMNACAYGPDFDPTKVTQTVNRWIVGETAAARVAFDAALDDYRFNDAATGLYAHIWRVFCDWYVEFAKPLLQGEDPGAKAETQATMAWALDQALILLHPIMPFITEAIWSETGPHAKPLIHADWPTYGAERVDAAAKAEMDWVIGLIEQIRSVRAEMNVAAGAKTGLRRVEMDEVAKGRFDRNQALIERLARVDAVSEGAPEKGSATLTLPGAVLALPLAGLVDIAAETARLEKAKAKAEKEAGGISAKLGNENFTSRAPAEVIEEQRARLAAAEAEAAKLTAALQRLAEMG